jgi:hypothetical protein
VINHTRSSETAKDQGQIPAGHSITQCHSGMEVAPFGMLSIQSVLNCVLYIVGFCITMLYILSCTDKVSGAAQCAVHCFMHVLCTQCPAYYSS